MAATSSEAQDELVFTALGGLGEIGMNVYLYGFGPPRDRKWLMVDLGLTFPGEKEPGVDVVLPDLRFIEAIKDQLVGIVITHAHEDHVGAVLDLWPRLRVPIYATGFTVGMLKSKLNDYGGGLEIKIKEVPIGASFKAGPFEIELVPMAHSIPEPSGLAIRTPAGLVFHTGDWKLDKTPIIGSPTDEERLAALGNEGVRVLVCDSTNVLRDGISPSETDIANSLIDIVKSAKRRVIITTFASNVGRIKAAADAAQASGRRLCIAGRSLHRVIQVAKDQGYLPDDLDYLDQRSFPEIDRRQMLLMCTGCQGESRAALARVADGEHPDIKLARGDLVIFSSRDIPGNERGIGAVKNKLVRMGVELLTDDQALVHVTGHPRRDELQTLYSLIKPEILIPMHGEARHLMEHARFAVKSGIPESVPVFNGEIVRLAPGPAKIIDEAPSGRLFRDGRLVIPSDEGAVRERLKLSQAGIAVVALAVNRRGDIITDPDVVLDGIPKHAKNGEEMYDVVLDAVDNAIDGLPKARRKNLDRLEDTIHRVVRSAISNEWGKRPIVKVMVALVEDA